MNGTTPEKTVQRILRDLPQRTAPASLETRVYAQLQRRHAASWQRGFAHWPATARVGFVALSVALVALTLMDVSSTAVGARLAAVGDWPTPRLYYAPAVLTWLGRFTARLAVAVPASWLDGAGPTTWLDGFVTLCALLYAILFGLGAVAYRTLYVSSSMAGDGR